MLEIDCSANMKEHSHKSQFIDRFSRERKVTNGWKDRTWAFREERWPKDRGTKFGNGKLKWVTSCLFGKKLQKRKLPRGIPKNTTQNSISRKGITKRPLDNELVIYIAPVVQGSEKRDLSVGVNGQKNVDNYQLKSWKLLCTVIKIRFVFTRKKEPVTEQYSKNHWIDVAWQLTDTGYSKIDHKKNLLIC